MGREVRMVPPDWQHPRDESRGPGRYKPLRDGYKDDLASFAADIERMGLGEAIDYNGGGPLSEDYMPDWPEAERTHWMMYECTSEGTPISPAFADPESLARWLADTKASAFAGEVATYEEWLSTIQRGYAMSAMVYDGRGLESGVSAQHRIDAQGMGRPTGETQSRETTGPVGS